MAYAEFVKQLHESDWFKKFIEEELLADMPRVPAYNPAEDNTERWKYDSGLREGYLLCLQKFGVKHYG